MNKELSKYRLKLAKDKLESAQILFKNKKFKDSVSRSYYAMFSAARALLAMKELNSAKHSGIISLFNQHFVKENLVNKELGRVLAEAKDLREDGDYKDFVIISEEETEKQLKDAEQFIEGVYSCLKDLWKE